jgi:hypothetical protein
MNIIESVLVNVKEEGRKRGYCTRNDGTLDIESKKNIRRKPYGNCIPEKLLLSFSSPTLSPDKVSYYGAIH